MHSEHKRNWIKNALRRASYRWPARGAVMKAARIGRNQYVCAKCQEVFGRKEVQMDHRKAVIDPKKGWTTWDDFIERLFVEEKGWQALCKPCHQEKSKKENVVRRKQKAKKPK